MVFNLRGVGRGVTALLLSGAWAVPSQYHDPAMLRLFFTDAAPERALTLAKQRIGELTGMLQFLEQPGLGGTQPAHRRVLSWGRMTVRADLAFWQSILDDIEGQL